jgi:hypothetical protein
MLPAVPSLYTSLEADRNEIRLVTFEKPYIGSTLIHCRLEIKSLDDIKDSYRAHLASEEVEDKPRRKDVIRWAAQCTKAPSSVGPMSWDAYRFNWGDYAALSYVWGTETQCSRIVLNGRKVSVTENLAIALGAMARSGDYVGQFKLWIDAICINQVDELERASQVSKMRDIYSRAWAVVAWLGEERDYSHDAFNLVQRFADMAEESSLQAFGELKLPSILFLGKCFFGLNELMRRPYWSRLWVVQELVLGASSTILCCGERTMSWNTFCDGINVLFRADMWIIKDHLLCGEVERLGLREHDSRWSTLWLHLVHKDLQVMSRREEKGNGQLGLRRLLDIACSSLCRDTRDKVFALMGMMEPCIASSLVHDYSTEPSELFAAVSREFITSFNNLEPLREGNPWGPVAAPSWAADWAWEGRLRYSRPETPLWGFWQSLDTYMYESTPDTTYSAASGRPAEFSFLGDRLLICKGFVFDAIAGLGARGSSYWEWETKSIVQFPSSWRSAYGGRDKTAEAFCKALLLGRMSGGMAPESRHKAIFTLPKQFDVARPQFERREWRWMASQDGYYFRWQRWREAHDHMQLGETKLGNYFSDIIPDGVEEKDYAEVYGAVDRTTKGRRFILTSKGYLGWAPDNIYGNDSEQTRLADLICIVFGCSTPLVIRPQNGQFQVVGEAYIEGFMDGEAMRLLGTGECAVQEFTFC